MNAYLYAANISNIKVSLCLQRGANAITHNRYTKCKRGNKNPSTTTNPLWFNKEPFDGKIASD